jgi:hypothetical protein
MKTPIIAFAAVAGLLGSVAVTPASAQTLPMGFPSYINSVVQCDLRASANGACTSACNPGEKPRPTVNAMMGNGRYLFFPTNVCYKMDLPIVKAVSSVTTSLKCPDGMILKNGMCLHKTDGTKNVPATEVKTPTMTCPGGYIINSAIPTTCVPNPKSTSVNF